MSDDYLIKEYTTTDDRIVRVYQDNDYGDPLKDELLDPETRKEMHELWLEGKVFRTEVFPRDIKLLDYENGVDVEFMGGFFGEDGPESYYPNVELYEVETLMENDEYRWCVLHDFHVGEGWTRSKEFTEYTGGKLLEVQAQVVCRGGINLFRRNNNQTRLEQRKTKMTQHEQHMEIYAASILGVLQVVVSKMLHVADKFNLLDKEELKNTAEKLRAIQEAPNKITERLNKVIEDEKQETENKYLKLYQDSEDMRKKCQRVIATMCAVEGVEDDDLDIIEAWSVVKCASGRVLVTVDYWKDNSTVLTYQFPVSWLDLSKKQLEERKVWCQLV